MRVLVHDYSGHPFQVQLSRRLAVRGYEVLHLYFGAFQTPRGSVCRLQCDPEGFDCRPLDLGTDFRKHDFFKRWIQEWQYGYRLVRETEGFAPDAVISANTPLDPQSLLLRHCRSRKIPFVFWLQDIYGAAIRRILSSRWPLRGRVVGSRYVALENRLLRRSDRVVAITEDFLPYLEAAGVDRDRIDVIHNWAPLDEVPEKPKDNPWSREAGLAEGFCFLYSGTLAMKHDPDVLARLAESFRGRREAKVAVVSEGPGAEHLRREKVRRSLDNLAILPFQPFEVFPEVLGAADVLAGVLEPEAGAWSVPSKVLTYHCAGRPLLLSVPGENLAARIVRENESGRVVEPGDADGFLDAARELYDDAPLRQALGRNARAYARRTFDAERIADRFQAVLDEATTERNGTER